MQCFCGLELRLGVKDFFMCKKHSLHALNIKIVNISVGLFKIADLY
jgi:hypothetical protein